MSHQENVIDLHGYGAVEAIEIFVNYYNNAVKNKDLRYIRVIHGYGSSGEGGEIRIRLMGFLDAHSDKLSYNCGDEVFGNRGETFIYPRSLLPSNFDVLQDKILEYCSTPKTKDKIIGKFLRYGNPKVIESLCNLEKQGKLSIINKGKYKMYSRLDNS